ncbi:MAG: amidohydrolase family protein [Phenylobacterium sp.]|uniref:amidohydrolase family protein n=1 Tax=Phenylobacterium sp. TaxID=1871053 RepID=UPI0039187F02
MREPEEILEPDLPICDPHHHLWDHPGSRYLIEELVADTGSGHRIESTVFVECMAFYRADGPEALRPVGETEFVNGVAAMSASGRYGAMRACAGIVGYADLTLGAGVDGVLEAHLRAGGGRFRGIRHAGGWDESEAVRDSHTNPPKGLYGSAAFREGYARLAAYGLSFEAWQYHPQLPEVTALARAFPDIPLVLDHVGGPLGIGPYEGRRTEVFAQWKADLADLAACPNVVVKLGGLGMPICGFGFHKREILPDSVELAEAWRPYIETCIELFGAERCMFESNFPVDRASCDYATLWNAFKRIAAGASPAEKALLFRDVARRTYRLEGE